MSARGLLVIGSVWFLAALVFGIRLSQTSFAIGWIVKGPVSNAGSLATIYVLVVCTALLLVGWTVPVGVGLYRLVRH